MKSRTIRPLLRIDHPQSVSRSPRFTLIELLVVVAIISVLAAMLLPVLGKAKRQVMQVDCLANEKQLYVGYALYSDDMDGTLPAKLTNWLSDVPSSSYNDLTVFYYYHTNEEMGWSLLYKAKYAVRDQLLGCKAEGGANRDESSTWKTYGLKGQGSTHYAYRYNCADQSQEYGRQVVKAFSSGPKVVVQLASGEYVAQEKKTPAVSAFIYEDPAYGIHFAGGNTSTEMVAMIANPQNWPHVTGGNVVALDGSGMFVKNSRFFSSPNVYRGWPTASYGPLGTLEYDRWGNAQHTSVLLDNLLLQR